MVKKNPDNDSIHSKSLILEDKDRRAIDSILSKSPVRVEERKISNPMNNREGLYINISSEERDDLFDDKTMERVKKAAEAVGYDPDRMDRGNLPTRKSPKRYDSYDTEYYTLAIWFNHRL